MAFLRFLRAAAARTGQLLNLTDLSRDVHVAVNTAKNWLSIRQGLLKKACGLSGWSPAKTLALS